MHTISPLLLTAGAWSRTPPCVSQYPHNKLAAYLAIFTLKFNKKYTSYAPKLHYFYQFPPPRIMLPYPLTDSRLPMLFNAYYWPLFVSRTPITNPQIFRSCCYEKMIKRKTNCIIFHCPRTPK